MMLNFQTFTLLYIESILTYNCTVKLGLDGNVLLEASGETEVVLPNYMTILSQDELKHVCAERYRERLIIAAGRVPDSDDIIMMTAMNTLMLLNVEKLSVPCGNVIPIDCGRLISFIGTDHKIAAGWMIDNATQIDINIC